MKRIPVEPSESPQHRRAREQRAHLDTIAAQLMASWPDRGDDPLTMEILRGLALAGSLDDAHPIDRHGHCTRWRCTRRWLLRRRPCSIRVTLTYCRSADTAMLWFHVFSQLLNSQMSLAEVRAWLTQCHTTTPRTDQPTTTPRHSQVNP